MKAGDIPTRIVITGVGVVSPIGIGKDAFDEGKEAARASIENQPRPVAVLNIAGMDDDVQQKTKRIDEDVTLASSDLLARIVALRVERGAPF